MDVNTRENKYSRVLNTNTQGQPPNLPLLCFFSFIWLAKKNFFLVFFIFTTDRGI